jgi:hypothetical protein
MPHCRTRKNGCQGIGNCSCECERCLDADDVAGQQYLDDNDVAEYMSISDADPGL